MNPAVMNIDTAPDVIKSYFRAINAEDWDALAEVFTPDATVSPAGEPTSTGTEAIVTWYRRTFRRFPVHHDEPLRAITASDGAAAAVEIRFTGETRTATAFDFRAVDLFDLRDGRIQTMQSWFDTAALLKTMGR